MSEAERKAFVDCVRWIASHEASDNGTWFPLIEQAEAEANRRYSTAPPPGDGGLREALEKSHCWACGTRLGDSKIGFDNLLARLLDALARPAQTQEKA